MWYYPRNLPYLYPASALWTFYVRSGDLQVFEGVPGVKVRQGQVRCAYSVAWWVEAELHRSGALFSSSPPALDDPPVSFDRALEACEWRRELEPRPLQVEAARRVYAYGGAHLWWSPGAGKAPAGFLAAVTHPGAALYVTPSLGGQGTLQHYREARRFLDLEPFLLKPVGSRKAPSIQCYGTTKGYDRCTRDTVTGWCVQHQHQVPAGWDDGGLPTAVSKDDLQHYLVQCREKQQRPFVICNWHQLRDNLDTLIHQLKPATVVFDEAHMAKDPDILQRRLEANGQRVFAWAPSIAGAAYQMAASAPRRICTTATPGYDSRIDLLSQLRLVEPWGWGFSRTAFLRYYCDAVEKVIKLPNGSRTVLSTSSADGSAGVSNDEQFLQRLTFAVDRRTYQETHGHLPPVVESVRWIPPSSQDRPLPGLRVEQRALERRLKQAKGVSEKASISAQLLELRLQSAADRKRKATVRAALEYSTAGKGKGLLFTGRKRAVEDRAKLLGRHFPGPIYTITGDSTPTERAEALKGYMDCDGPAMLLLMYQSAGTGLNLQDTDFVLFDMLPLSPGAIEQAVGRGDRIGRTRPLHVLILVAEETADEWALDIAREKLETTSTVNEGAKSNTWSAMLTGMDEGRKVQLIQSVVDMMKASLE